MKKQHNKLVRDKIPEKLASKNIAAKHHTIKTNHDFHDCLLDIEKLCDIVEVIAAILKFRNISEKDFEKIREEKKHEKRQIRKTNLFGFNRRIEKENENDPTI